MSGTNILLIIITVEVALFAGEIVFQLTKIRDALQADLAARLHAAFQKDIAVISPKEPKPRKPGMPRI